MFTDAWKDFNTGEWTSDINVRDFIQKNYTAYTGDDSFLRPASPLTQKLMKKLELLLEKKRMQVVYLG